MDAPPQLRRPHRADSTQSSTATTITSNSDTSRDSASSTTSQHGGSGGSRSWTDDLPVCHAAAIGAANNARYRTDGSRTEQHAPTDRHLHARIDEHISLYAVFSGLGAGPSAAVAEAALNALAAEIVFAQLQERRRGDDEVRAVLRVAVEAAERGYAESIDTQLAKKAMLQCELEGISQWEISRQYQAIVDQLNHIQRELAVGASVVLALIYWGRLFICNVGGCRALLCRNDAQGVLHVTQLSVEHSLHNEDEVLRLTQMGLDVETVRQTDFFTTRCIGAYAGKAGYRDCTHLSAATAQPIAAEPEIVGAIPLDASCRFLLLMSGGLCRTLYDIAAAEAAADGGGGSAVAASELIVATNREIVRLVVDEFREQETLSGVAQTSANRVVQRHHDCYMRSVAAEAAADAVASLQRRSDITLLVRNFNFPMPKAIQRRAGAGGLASMGGGSMAAGDNRGTLRAADNGVAATNNVPDYFHTTTGVDAHSLADTGSSTRSLAYRTERETSDSNDRKPIEPYVDFGEFNRRYAAARERGQLSERMQPPAPASP